MKIILWLIISSLSCFGGEPTRVASPVVASDASLDPKSELAGKLAEDFDWTGYFGRAADSTGVRYSFAATANQVMRGRLDQLCAAMRETLGKTSPQALESFDRMQKLWEQSAEAEIAFVGSEYEGGSQAKVSFATHRFKVYLRRVRELKELAKTAHFYQ